MRIEGAVIFDADGTLADSLPPHVAFCRMMNEELRAGLLLPETSDLDGCRALAAAPMDNFLRRAGFAGGDVDTAVQRYERSFADEFPVGLFDKVPAMLQTLAEQGLRMAVVSSNTSKNVRACLAQHSGVPLANCFEFIWGIDNAARSKAESLAHAAAEMGLAPQQIVYVGDTEKDARCAQACGMQFVGADWGGFEDMGRLASAAASAEGVEGLAPYTAVQSPSAVPSEVLRLIQSSSISSSKNLSCESRSPQSVEQGLAQSQSFALSPYDAAGWWSFLWFSWMTPLYDKKGEDLKLELDAEVAFADWSTPRRDAPDAQAAKLQVSVCARACALLRVLQHTRARYRSLSLSLLLSPLSFLPSLPVADSVSSRPPSLSTSQQAWNDSGENPRLLDVFWSIYGRWWLQIASLKLVGMVSVVGTPLLIKAFLGQLQLHTASVDTTAAEDRWPFWLLLALVPTMTACSFLYTFMWHQ